MTCTEKEKIYNLLKTISDNFYGYSSPEFEESISFEDDAPLLESDATYSLSNGDSHAAFTAVHSGEGVENVSPKDFGNGLSLEKIAARIAECKCCRLCETRNKTVAGQGVENPVVLVIGEGPGEEEDHQGLPFVGPAGKLLDKMLASILLSRTVNCYIANIVKCRPPKNRTPFLDEADSCRAFLDAQIQVLKPKMILCAGRCAIQNLLHTEDSLSRLRGKFFEYGTIPVLATYHPSALLRDASNKRPAWEDLKMFRAKLLEIAPDYANGFGSDS